MDNTLAAFVRMRRDDLKLSQRGLADIVGVEQQTVSRWESGESAVRPRYLPGLARALRTEVGELYFLAGLIPPEPHEGEDLVAALRRAVHAMSDNQLLDVVDVAWMTHRTRRATSQ